MINVRSSHARTYSSIAAKPDTLDTIDLPSPLTSLVGRSAELEAIATHLDTTEIRLLTLLGPGGVGKTRLAIRAGQLWAERHQKQVAWVDLSPLNDPTLVRSEIASALGIKIGEDRTLATRLHEAIGKRRLLLVIDNFEQVVTAGNVVFELLVACPNTTALVTSRRPLRFQGEQEFDVSPLRLVGPEKVSSARDLEADDAATLFLQRARAATPNLRVSDGTARAIAEICQRLDGLPLALELASAQTRLFSPEELLRRMNGQGAALLSGPRDLPSRQRTIRDTIRWSYDLLTAEEQKIFHRISLFAGSFSLQAAVEVIGAFERNRDAVIDESAFLDAIQSLTEKSLIGRIEDEEGSYRFRLLETIREFGVDGLRRTGEIEAMRIALLDYFTDLVVTIEPDLLGPDQVRLIQKVEAEKGSLRVALQSALDLGGDAPEKGLALATSMWRYWLVRGQFNEAAQWLGQFLEAAPGSPTETRALAMNRLGNLNLEMGRNDIAREHYLKSMEAYRSIDHEDGMADEMNNLALLELLAGNFEAAQEQLQACVAIRRKLDQTMPMTSCLSNLGDIAHYHSRFDEAEAYHREALAIRRERGNYRGVAISLCNLGIVALSRGRLEQAEALFAEALSNTTQIKDIYTEGAIYLAQGRLYGRRGELGQAMDVLLQALANFRQAGIQRMVTEAIEAIAEPAIQAGHVREAAILVARARAFRRQAGIGFTIKRPSENAALDHALSSRLSPLDMETLVDEGERLSLDQATERVVAMANQIREQSLAPVAANLVKETSLDVHLTSREREVLTLIAAGLSDKEIADALFISPRTAMSHVGNVLNKLGVRKRGQAGTLALQAGLVDEQAVSSRLVTDTAVGA